MTTKQYGPFTLYDHVEGVGRNLDIKNVKATVPGALLPRELQLLGDYADHGGSRIFLYRLQHDGVLVTFPRIIGDGSQHLASVTGWLARHQYKTKDGDFYTRNPE